MATLERKSNDTLYHRLGGYDVIAAVIDDLFLQLRGDPKFARFASGRSFDSHSRSRQLLVEQMCSLTGGSCFYMGRDMKTSHVGLAITESEWEANMAYTAAALDKNRVPAKEKAEFLDIFSRYKGEIVEKT
jgi:hemoglobin